MTANNAPGDYVLGENDMVSILKTTNVPESVLLPNHLIYQVLPMIPGQVGHLIFNNQVEHEQWNSRLIQIKRLFARITYLEQTASRGFDCVVALKTTFIPAVLNLIRIYGKTMVPTDIRLSFTTVCRNVSTIDEILILPDNGWPEMVVFDKTRRGFIGLNPSLKKDMTLHHITGHNEIDLSPIELLVDEQDENVLMSIEVLVIEDVADEDDA